jgi:hypothetical protein
MPNSKKFISFLIVVLFSFYCKAQDNAANGGEAAPVADSVSTANTVVLPDTILRLNSLTISRDSITALKNSKPFAYAKNLDSLLKALKNRNRETSLRNIKDDRSDWLDKLLGSSFVSILLWTLAAVFIAYILYRLFFIEGAFFSGRIKRRSNVNELKEETADMQQNDYNRLIAQAVHNKDYRVAVRYLYLKVLQGLAEKGLVQLEAEKTNYQYLNELNNTVYKKDFSVLTHNYEYVWYGEFSINEIQFTELKNNFEQFNNRL